jgi:hypothetical protein
MTKSTNRSRGGLSPSRGPGRGLPAHTRVYARPRVALEGWPHPARAQRPRPVYAARRMTPTAAPSRQLGTPHLGITSIYLQGIDTREIVDAVHHRRPPVISASAGLRPLDTREGTLTRRITRPSAVTNLETHYRNALSGSQCVRKGSRSTAARATVS